MNLSLIFADCEVAAVSSMADGVEVRLSAAHVLRAAVEPNGKSLNGYARAVTLRLAGATLAGATDQLIGRISQGRVQIKDVWLSTIALPSAVGGPVKLELGFANQSNLVLSAIGFECRFDGEPNFAESLFC